MRSLTHTILATSLMLTATVLVGCSATSPNPRASAKAQLHNDQESPYSPIVETALRQRNISLPQVDDLDTFERSSDVTSITPEEVGLLILSEAYLARAATVTTTATAASIDALLRSAHFAYEGLLSQGCSRLDTEPCKLLLSAYSRAVSQIARATNFGTAPLQHTDSDRYTLDFEGDHDPLTPAEWNFILPAETTNRRQGVGATLVACTKRDDATATSSPALCIPATFLVHFDTPARDGGTRAHLVAHDAFDHTSIDLHGREFPLAANIRATWSTLLQNESPLTCLGELLPQGPSVVLLVDDAPTRSDWSEIGESLAVDTTLSAIYNLCAYHTKSATDISVVLGESLATSNQPATVVLVSQGVHNDHTASSLASRSKAESLLAKKSGGRSLLTVAGAISVPARARNRTGGSDISQTRSQSSVVAERDIKRLLSRLIEEDLVPVPTVGRGPSASPFDLSLSPVM